MASSLKDKNLFLTLLAPTLLDWREQLESSTIVILIADVERIFMDFSQKDQKEHFPF
jgi:hypothetical protein